MVEVLYMVDTHPSGKPSCTGTVLINLTTSRGSVSVQV